MNNLAYFSGAFLLGVCALYAFPSLPDMPWMGVLMLGAVLLMFRRLPILAGLILGIAWAGWWAGLQLQHRLPAQFEGQDIQIVGRVDGLPQKLEHATRFELVVEETPGHPELSRHIRRIRLNWYARQAPVRAGERWKLTVRLKRPNGFANPFGFDYEAWLFHQRIDATGYVRQKSANQRQDSQAAVCVHCWRQAIADRIDQLDSNLHHIGLIRALIIGDRQRMSADQWQVLRQTGTSHLLAISGLHIGLVAGFVFAGCRGLLLLLFRGRVDSYRWAVLAALLGSGLYASLAGFAVPAQRAWVMVVVLMLALLGQRHVRTSHVFSLALLAVLVADPFAVMSAGFWLSFAAVGVLLWSLSGRLGGVSRWRDLLRAQWVVALGLAPLLMLFFQQVPVVGPLANAFAVPWVSFIVVPLVLIGAVLILLHDGLATIVFELADRALALLWACLEPMSNTSLMDWQPVPTSLASYVLAAVAAILLLAPRGLPGKFMLPLLLLPVLYPVQRAIQPGDLRMTLLDVGQGLAAVVETRSHVLVYDTGANWGDRFIVAESVLVPYLHGQGKQAIDRLIVSHGDNDHAGGVQSLLDEFPVGHILTSVPERIPGGNVSQCRAGQTWVWDDVRFTMIHPGHDGIYSGNNASCVLRIESGNGSILMTGDIEKQVERQLLRRVSEALDVDILIAPHHGSATSSSPEFVGQVSPRIVLFPVGYRNRFGFPRHEVLARYRESGSEIYDTASHGALTVELRAGEPVQVEAYRQTARRLWHRRPEVDSRSFLKSSNMPG